MLLTLTIWHGGAEQRAAARAESSQFFHLVRRLGLLELAKPNDRIAFSFLHHLSPNAQPDPSHWSWHFWAEQEKRSRIMYLVHLLDAALLICFNSTSQFSSSELKEPLPCDDAAWTPRMPKSVRRHWVCEASSCNNRRILLGPGCSHSLRSMTL